VAISVGGVLPQKIYYGSTPVKEVWVGSSKVWPAGPQWVVADDFDGSQLDKSVWESTDNFSVGGGYITKDPVNGQSAAWTYSGVSGTSAYIEVKLATATSGADRTSLALGTPSSYVFAEFNATGGLIGEYAGGGWPTLSTYSFRSPVSKGARIGFERLGSSLSLTVDGSPVSSARTSLVGPYTQRGSFTLRRSSSWLSVNFSPSIDEFRLGKK